LIFGVIEAQRSPSLILGVLDTRYLRPRRPFIWISDLVLVLVFWQSILGHIDHYWSIAVRHYEDSSRPRSPVLPSWILPRYPAKPERPRSNGCRFSSLAAWLLSVVYFSHDVRILKVDSGLSAVPDPLRSNISSPPFGGWFHGLRPIRVGVIFAHLAESKRRTCKP